VIAKSPECIYSCKAYLKSTTSLFLSIFSKTFVKFLQSSENDKLTKTLWKDLIRIFRDKLLASPDIKPETKEYINKIADDLNKRIDDMPPPRTETEIIQQLITAKGGNVQVAMAGDTVHLEVPPTVVTPSEDLTYYKKKVEELIKQCDDLKKQLDNKTK
jgi:hypothetical protein